jgi:AcrR family transcriptional regulator
MSSPSPTTKTAIMDAAERLFAARGFKSTSMRAITSAAKANLGAVNYHFTTKDALILAVLSRRMKPLNEQSSSMLDRLENAGTARPVAVEEILEALFRPPLELIAKRSQGGRNFLRLIAFVFTEPGDYLKPLIEEQLAGKLCRFHTALRRIMPGLSETDAYWAMHFSYGAFVHTLSNPHILELTSRGHCKVSDTEKTLRRIVGYCAAGFRAAAKSGSAGRIHPTS